MYACIYLYISFSSFLSLLFFFSITIVASDVCVGTRMLLKGETTPTFSPLRRPLPIQRHRPSCSTRSLTNAQVCEGREARKKIDIRSYYCCICFLYRARTFAIDRERNTMKVVNAHKRERQRAREKRAKRNLYIFMLLFAC